MGMSPPEPAEARIVSVNVARPSVLLRWDGGEVISAIDKHPVQAATVELSEFNLDGDEQADTRPTPAGGQVHGGPHQAVYAYPSEHYARLEELLDRQLSWGFMGENLTVEGAIERDVRIGDVWIWGSARLQVSAPRGPCFKLGIRIGRQAVRTVIREEALVGWYLRVLSPGTVPTEGLIEIDGHVQGPTVADVQLALNDRSKTFPHLAVEELAPNVRHALRTRHRDLTGGVPETD